SPSSACSKAMASRSQLSCEYNGVTIPKNKSEIGWVRPSGYSMGSSSTWAMKSVTAVITDSASPSSPILQSDVSAHQSAQACNDCSNPADCAFDTSKDSALGGRTESKTNLPTLSGNSSAYVAPSFVP